MTFAPQPKLIPLRDQPGAPKLFDDQEVIAATRALRLAHDAMRQVSLHGNAVEANQAFVNLGEARRQWHQAVGIQL